MATSTASLSIVLAPDASHSYVAIGSATAGLNCFAYYDESLTAVDQIEFQLATSGLSVSTNGAYSVVGATSPVNIPFRRWAAGSAQWHATATAVYYPYLLLLPITLLPDSSHSYADIATPVTGLNTFVNYVSSLTAGDQIEYHMVTSGLSVSSDGSISVTGAISNVSFGYRRRSAIAQAWGATATATYYPNNLILPGVGSFAFAGAQPSLYGSRVVPVGAGVVAFVGPQAAVGGATAVHTASISLVLVPDASHSYVALVSASSGPGFLSASPSLAVGAQIEYQEYLRSAGGVTSLRVYVRDDASFYTDSAVPLSVYTFNWRAWQSGVWSTTATATLDMGGRIDVFIPGPATVSFIGNTPNVVRSATIAAPGVGDLRFDGRNPAYLQDRSDIQPGVGAFSFSGSAPDTPFQKSPLPGVGSFAFIGLQPTISIINFPIIRVGEGQQENPLRFIGNHVDIVVIGQSNPGVASLGFLGHAPNIIAMGRWEQTSAYSLTWS